MSKEKKPEKVKQPGRVKHEQGLADYLKMGPDRSLKKLWTRYCDTMVAPPALVTIESWSQRFAWVAKAQAFDERLAARLQEKVADASLEETWDRVKDLTALAKRLVDKAFEGLEGDTLKATTPYDVAALTNTAMGVIKAAELLAGSRALRDRRDPGLRRSCRSWSRRTSPTWRRGPGYL